MKPVFPVKCSPDAAKGNDLVTILSEVPTGGAFVISRAVTLEDIFNECCSTWAKDCNSDAEYQASMEAFIEACEANNYTFTASGRMENI